ncbi:alpha-mannosidase 2-like isoform X2 [Agrilus planipennis]|uniref:Alpha-mannosidase n=1 Tax=Agrilus planipennis TaxID=224129 RepID=A0A1W4XNT9_AGRPL|nr:alpha-mannosidase 2-like isoform X2 [Agrilus planipennis]
MRLRKTVSLFITLATVTSFIGILILTENFVLNNRSNKFDEEILHSKRGDVDIIDSQPQNNENTEYNEDSLYNNLEIKPASDIQMLELYKQIKFDNKDGGVWKQGWNIKLNNSRWNQQRKLNVFVVPHSHNDPGWKLTIDEYYEDYTNSILNNIVAKLKEDSRRKFIWAEISYFSMWWNDISNQKRESVKQLLKQNQLEIVTGGWVMNDEANSNWLSIVHQLSEGHQWLQKNLNYTPRSGWTIDPFGLSPTQAFLLKNSGFQNLLIQRVHYAVKKQLALQTDLEFNWKQIWDDVGETQLFTHMMPFYFYDIPHTCGPDPKVCCQFDFKRFSKFGLFCPWKVPPKLITDQNVAERAALLLDQYKKKSMLFRSNVLLIPLGDDFRYSLSSECDEQFDNYQRLMDHMNHNENMNVQIQFGTLTDYFDAVHKEMKDEDFSTISGDFFTYCDVDDHYWSGYYTSRPFYKRMDRILLHYLRGAEIILSLTQLSRKFHLNWEYFETILSKARQSLALFQHHDGITGTAKDHVVIDYSERMLNSINNLQEVISDLVNVLLAEESESGIGDGVYKIDDVWTKQDSLSQQYEIDASNFLGFKTVAIYNSLPFERQEVVTFMISTPFVQVLDIEGKTIECQISPIFEQINKQLRILDIYELSFVAIVKPLALARYTIQTVEEKDVPSETYYSKIKLINYNKNDVIDSGVATGVFKNLDVIPRASSFSLVNDHFKANFASTGLLDSIEIGEKSTPVQLDFAKYGVRNKAVRSGAYLFLPDGPAVPLKNKNKNIKVIEGPIVSKVQVNLFTVNHTVKIFNYLGAEKFGIEVENLVDIKKTHNFELAMRLTTDIKSSDDFFTDLNNYQVSAQFYEENVSLNFHFKPIIIQCRQ